MSLSPINAPSMITSSSTRSIAPSDQDHEPFDSGFPIRDRPFAIGPGDPLLMAWNEELMSAIIGMLDEKLINWTSVNVIRMGEGAE